MGIPVRLKGKTASSWATENPVLLERQPGFELNTRKVKFGDGETAWNALPYAYYSIDEIATLLGGKSDNGHGHTISEISGLEVSLASKASLSHTHPQSDIVGLGAALSNKADLVGGLVPAVQLPGYVDDVLEYLTAADFPATGESGKLYVTTVTNKAYRWSGSAYIVISDTIALGETSSTAYRGDRGKIAYDHSQSTGNPHSTAIGDIDGLTASLAGKSAVGHTHPQSDIVGLGAALANKADLVGGLIPSTQLPGYVDDVLEYATAGDFPGTGESGKLYVSIATNKAYRWSGSAYVVISDTITLGETSSTAYRGDRGKTAYDHSQITGANPHATTFDSLPDLSVVGKAYGHISTPGLESIATIKPDGTLDVQSIARIRKAMGFQIAKQLAIAQTTSATAVMLTDLVVDVDANSSYEIEVIIAMGCNGVGGVKLGCTFPAGASCNVGYIGAITSSATQSEQWANVTSGVFITQAFNIMMGQTGFAVLYFSIETGVTAGQFTMQYASVTLGQQSRIYNNMSHIKATKVNV